MKQWHLLTYDVRDHKRLGKLHRYLKKQGLPLQKSVFLLHCTSSELASLLQVVRDIIHLRQDDLRLFPVQSLADCWASGQQHFITTNHVPAAQLLVA